MEGGQQLLDYYCLLTVVFWLAISILIWGIIIILHKVHVTSCTDHEDTSVVNKVVSDDIIDDDTITGTSDKDEQELRFWYLAITATKPLTNPFPKTEYRLNLKNVSRLPTIIEIPVTEKLEEVGIDEYCSEVCTANNHVINSTTNDGGDDDDDNRNDEEELHSWHSAIAATNPNPCPKTDYRMNLRDVCRLPAIIELPISEKLEEVGIEEYYYSEMCTANNHGNDGMNSTTDDGGDDDMYNAGGVINEDYGNDDNKWITDELEGHSSDYKDSNVDSINEVDVTATTDIVESETCVGQSFGPRDDGYNSMIDFVKEDQVNESEGQMQPINEDFKETVTKHVIELDERFKTIEKIVDALEEEHQAKMMEQQKKFEQELKVKLEDQAKASEQKMQVFKEEFKETVIKHLVKLDEGCKIIWQMVDSLEEDHQVNMMEERKMFKEELRRKLVEQENIMKIQQQIKSEEERKKFEEELHVKLADLRRSLKVVAKKEKREIQGLSKHFTFTLTEAQQIQVDELNKKLNEKIMEAEETYMKKFEVLKEKKRADLKLHSQYLIEDKEWKFNKIRRRFNKKLRKLVKDWRKKCNGEVASPDDQ